MEHFISDGYEMQGPLFDDENPLDSLIIESPNSIEMPDEYFTFTKENDESKKEDNEYYDKKKSLFPNLEDEPECNEAEFPEIIKIKHKYSHHHLIPPEEGAFIDEHAVNKFQNIYKVPVSVQLDQVSMISQVSIDSPKTHNKVHSEFGLLSDSSKDNFSKSNCENSTQMNIKKWKETKKVGEQIEEEPSDGSLVFIIRRINKRTNTSVLLTKHRKKITKCSHRDQEYYAKGM